MEVRDDCSLKLRCSLWQGWAGKGLESAEKETEKEAEDEDEDRDLLTVHVDDGVLDVGVLENVVRKYRENTEKYREINEKLMRKYRETTEKARKKLPKDY